MLIPTIAVLTLLINTFELVKPLLRPRRERSSQPNNFGPQITDLANAKREKIQEFELPRRPSDFHDALNLLWSQVWYNRHQDVRIAIEEGHHRVVSRKPHSPDETLDTAWTQELAAARRMEEDVGLDRLGPWTDFEWGMINGKMSALEWMLGDEWDIDVTPEGAENRKWTVASRCRDARLD